jgi:cytochrome c-type biogenesis protein CcmE
MTADGHFAASEVLAKHDETYMPPEAAQAVDDAQKAATKHVSPSSVSPPKASY